LTLLDVMAQSQRISAPRKGRGTAKRPRLSHKKRVMKIGGERKNSMVNSQRPDSKRSE
jgi:hypothetical protein